MSPLTIPELEIIRTPLSWENGYDYVIRFTDPARQAGDAQIVFKPVEFYQFTAHGRRFLEEGLTQEDIVANLVDFYPNGRALDEDKGEHMRAGVGTKVLERIVLDAKERNAKVMFGVSAKTSLYAFAEKHGFTHVGRYHVYKLI